MRKPEIDKDYVLLQAYKCFQCDFYAGFLLGMVDHIENEHPETLQN